MARQDRHRARGKGRGQGAALLPPILAPAQQQPLAEQRAQDADAGGGAAVIRRIVDQDMLDAGGPAHDDLPATEDAAKDDVLLEGLRRKDADRVVAQRAREIARRRRLGPVRPPAAEERCCASVILPTPCQPCPSPERSSSVRADANPRGRRAQQRQQQQRQQHGAADPQPGVVEGGDKPGALDRAARRDRASPGRPGRSRTPVKRSVGSPTRRAAAASPA